VYKPGAKWGTRGEVPTYIGGMNPIDHVCMEKESERESYVWKGDDL